MTNTEFKIPETNENFEELLNEQFGENAKSEIGCGIWRNVD